MCRMRSRPLSEGKPPQCQSETGSSPRSPALEECIGSHSLRPEYSHRQAVLEGDTVWLLLHIAVPPVVQYCMQAAVAGTAGRNCTAGQGCMAPGIAHWQGQRTAAAAPLQRTSFGDAGAKDEITG